MAAWQYYYRRAREHGLEAGIWVGPHLSQNAPIVKAHPDWMACAPTTMPASGGYPDPMTCMNWGTGVRQWVFDDLRRWKEEGGLDYIWFDSLGNLGMFPVDFVHRMQGSTFALAEFFADLQTIGIATIEVEGSSPFGTAAYHLFDPNRGRLADVQGIVGQNTLDWYAGNEDMLCDQQPRLGLHRDRGEEEVRQMFFRFLANRAVPQLGRHSVAFGPRPEWFRAYLDTYFVVEDDLVRRHLLPGRRGVRWSGGGADILFAFEGFPFDVGGVAVERIAGGAPHTVVHAGVLQAEPWTVYRMH